MLTQDACVGWIVSLVEAEDPSAVRSSLAEADAFLSSFWRSVRHCGSPRRLGSRASRALAQDRAGGPSDRSHRQRDKR